MANITLIQNPVISPISLKDQGYKFIVSKADSQDGVFQFTDMSSLINHSFVSGYLYDIGDQVIAVSSVSSKYFMFVNTIANNTLPPFSGSGDTLNIGWEVANRSPYGYNYADDLGYMTQKNFKENVVHTIGSPPAVEDYRVPSVKWVGYKIATDIASSAEVSKYSPIYRGDTSAIGVMDGEVFTYGRISTGSLTFVTSQQVGSNIVIGNFPVSDSLSIPFSNIIYFNVNSMDGLTPRVLNLKERNGNIEIHSVGTLPSSTTFYGNFTYSDISSIDGK